MKQLERVDMITLCMAVILLFAMVATLGIIYAVHAFRRWGCEDLCLDRETECVSEGRIGCATNAAVCLEACR